MKLTIDIILFYAAFASYFIGLLTFSLFAAVKRRVLHVLGAVIMLSGALCHAVAFFVRWYLSGHIPLSNMYEYLSLMSLSAVVMLLILYRKYDRPVIGTFISPVVFMLMVAAALLPKDINQSLMPALQSIWLNIHVSLAALGAGCFMVAFAVSILYLLKQYEPLNNKHGHFKKQIWTAVICLLAIPLVFTLIAALAGFMPPAPHSTLLLGKWAVDIGGVFILSGLGFILGLLVAPFAWSRVKGNFPNGFGGWLFIVTTIIILCGGLIEGILLKAGWLKLTHTLTPVGHAQSIKSAWLFFEFMGFAYLTGIILSLALFPAISRISGGFAGFASLNIDLLDEVSYKSVSMGYPLYTVGALFAGAIWAEQAWGSFWSWDPKEVGALIIWLFYSGYLHARYQRNWKGSRAAILVVAGFVMLLISFFGNYFFGGLHAYT